MYIVNVAHKIRGLFFYTKTTKIGTLYRTNSNECRELTFFFLFTAVWVLGTAIAVGIAAVVISTSVIGYFVRRHFLQQKLTNGVDKETLN